MNVLLAVVFTNYKERIVVLADEKTEKRIELIGYYVDYFDEDSKGYLTFPESKRFFKTVFDLTYKKESDKAYFKLLAKVIDTEDKQILTREGIVEFFS